MSEALPPSNSVSLNPYPQPQAARISLPEPGNTSNSRPSGVCPLCVNSTDLLRGQKTVEINHNGSTYRLQATRLGKLILTK